MNEYFILLYNVRYLKSYCIYIYSSLSIILGVKYFVFSYILYLYFFYGGESDDYY